MVEFQHENTGPAVPCELSPTPKPEPLVEAYSVGEVKWLRTLYLDAKAGSTRSRALFDHTTGLLPNTLPGPAMR